MVLKLFRTEYDNNAAAFPPKRLLGFFPSNAVINTTLGPGSLLSDDDVDDDLLLLLLLLLLPFLPSPPLLPPLRLILAASVDLKKES